jgi:hypothetical protein
MSRNMIGRLIAATLLCGELLFGLATPPAHAQVLEWVRQFGFADTELSFGVSADGLGNVYIAGTVPGCTVGCNNDASVIKYDSAGDLLWVRQFGSSDFSHGETSYGVSAGGLGNVYISGFWDGDAFVSNFDAAGNLQWTRQLGTSSYGDDSYGVSADGAGNVYITGVTPGSLAGPNAGVNDAFVAKYDSAGDLLWTRQIGTTFDEHGSGVSADGLGNVFITGTTYETFDDSMFISKFDAAGNLQWTRQLATTGLDSSQGISADGLGNAYITGRTGGNLGGPNAGEYDAFVAKYDSAGDIQWIRQLGTSGSDGSNGVSADGLGNIYISGETNGSLGRVSAGNSDAFVAKYDSEGNLQWTSQLGSSSHDHSRGVSADGLGHVYISGYTTGSLGVPSGGEADAFIAKFNDCEGCEPPAIPPFVVEVDLAGEILPGSLVTHQFTTSFGDLPITWGDLVPTRSTVNPPTLSESGLFSWQTSKLDGSGIYHFDVTATNAGGSDVGRLILRLAIIPEPSALALTVIAGSLLSWLRRRVE